MAGHIETNFTHKDGIELTRHIALNQGYEVTPQLFTFSSSLLTYEYLGTK